MILERTVVGIMRRREMISEPWLSHLLLLEHIFEPKDRTRALLVGESLTIDVTEPVRANDMRDLCRIRVVVGHTSSAEALDHLGPVLHALARVMALVRLHVEDAP